MPDALLSGSQHRAAAADTLTHDKEAVFFGSARDEGRLDTPTPHALLVAIL